MKKFYSTLILTVALLGSIHGQYYLLESPNAGTNPAGLNSDIEETPAYVINVMNLGWTQILSSTSTDQWSANQTLPFSFHFNGAVETSYKVSNTGVLTFSTSATSVPGTANAALPSSLVPDKSVCVWGLNLSGANDGVITKTFGTAPHRQHWVTFASSSHPGLAGGYSYWSIVLEEGSDNIYIIDQRTLASTSTGNVAITAGIQINASTAFSVNGSPALGSLSAAAADASDNSFYEFVYGTQPTEDMALIEYTVSPVQAINFPLSSAVRVRTQGSNPVTSFDLNYSVNGGATVTSGVTGVNLTAGSYYEATLSSPYIPATAGAYTLDIWVSNVNNGNDLVNDNDTVSVSFTAAASTPRNFLAEEFSSSTCPPCKSWNDNVYNTALANFNTSANNKIVVKYQVPIPTPGDPSRNPHSDARRAYYGINSAPSMVANGAVVDYSNAPGGTWGDALIYFNQIAAEGAAEPAFVAIANASADVEMLTANTMKVTVTADITPNIDLNSGDHRAQIVVMQENYVFNGATNGDYNYHHVARRMLPDPNGTALNVTTGNTQTITQSYTFTVGNVLMGNFNLWNEDIEVLIKVENKTQKKIMNAELASINLVGMEEATARFDIQLYPNPVTDILFIEGNILSDDTHLEIINSIGNKVYSQSFSGASSIEVPTSDMAPGIYILNVTINGKTDSRRISVVR